MEDIAVHCSWADAQLNEDASLARKLPIELRTLIVQSTGSRYLDLLADAARESQFADTLFPLYKILYPELVARWSTPPPSHFHEAVLSLACWARILPFATYLRHHVREYLASEALLISLAELGGDSSEVNGDTLHLCLLALFRLLSFDRDILAATTTAPTFFSSLLRHPSLPIRYLAVQSLCMVMHFADAFSEQMVETYVGSQPIMGDWEGRTIDYRLLKLWEESRWKDLAHSVADVERRTQQAMPPSQLRKLNAQDLDPQTANVGGVLLPRSGRLDKTTSSFVLTPTAQRNLQQLGKCLLEQKPILLLGQASSGKTFLVHEAARLLNKLSLMVTLHLNEQTDAKSLLGVYTSSADGESFIWQAGVLTKAIQQGRWVLLEDIDRAPAEVVGMLRPIVENGELFLANRKETIRPKEGFRIFATLTSTSRSPLTSTSRQSWLLNPRLWSAVGTVPYEPTEIEALLHSRYPAAEALITTILGVHEQICLLYQNDDRLKKLQTRAPSLRDLLNWTRRTVRRLNDHDRVSTSNALPNTTKFHMFQDAVDCYAGYLSDDEIHELVAAAIAREMGISPQQMRHCLDEGFTNVTETPSAVYIGRSTLIKVTSRRRQTHKAPFAVTRYARRTLDRIAASASCSEPCLLVGETGVGKTTLIQHVASLVGQKLTVVNLSQQSEASDLLGGLKPVTTRSLVIPLVEKFDSLFEDTFSTKRNEKFQIAVTKAVAKQNWPRLAILWNEAIQLAANSLNAVPDSPKAADSAHASKKRKLMSPKYDILRSRWSVFSESFQNLRPQLISGDKNHAFAFVEGRLVQAVREGEWVLLDEINLASPDTLDSVVSLLHNGDDEKPYLLLAEAGNIESVVAHPNFRIFAAMNPATDAGKKDLPPGLRSRFTEIYVPSGDGNLEDLTKIIQTYLGSQLDSDKRAALDLAKAYLDLKKLNQEHKLTDGAGDIPHFSIRSLVRCLLYASQHGASHGLRRAMYEGFAMSFFTVLSRASENLALPFLENHLLSNIKNRKSFLNQQPKMSLNGEEYVAFRHHIVKKGPLTPDFQPHYIRTPSVERNLLNLARAASMRRFPILLQGPTSAGKTSMVEYLAKLSGNRFVRINNHEHTDLQEYLGSYVSDADGKLQYREGVLVDALRQGHWIVLDELNLAPSDVLEALNRLLDDNRELLIPESQEVVRPHPNFMLFATQNPAGLYGGRKRLSRAFRNRFLELHFDDIPEDELEIILRERAQIAPSFCTQIVAVYKSLSLQRQSSRLFEQRNSFATLRDLFRWASRPVDDRQKLACHGFMLLAERVRDPAERAVVKRTIEETMKVTIDERVLYGLSVIPDAVQESGSVVWTPAMRRLFVLVAEALKNHEPVLLVGETGCGKTQICQVIAVAFGQSLDMYNAHTNTETGDLIGSQRPVRNRSELANDVRESWLAMVASGPEHAPQGDVDIQRFVTDFATIDKSPYDPRAVERTRASIGAYQSLFAWSDGSLVRAMKTGHHFLLDEISLADDSVLERLNSVLEPSRTILLAEKGSVDNLVVADPNFQFLATMNPGGDYGKRELSAALRNRLTEIWVPPLSQEADILPIVQNKLVANQKHLAEMMLTFASWFRRSFHSTASGIVPLRDLLAWAEFINRVMYLGEEIAFVQGAFMVFVDSLGANPAGMTSVGATDLNESRHKCLHQLQTLVNVDVFELYQGTPQLRAADDLLYVGPFSLPRSTEEMQEQPDLVFDAPTTLQNTMRIVRALQMTRPILLEGSPGVGKTAIVTALARASGKPFTRINLSDQTDLMDLFGADAPSADEQIGTFSWQNGPLLEAMQSGGWVLLDEMNLASQSVLEGLNSCLDHRREVYIAELDKSFACHPDFTLFATQNPHHQGGGRKGLPASFVNRFTVVYADAFQQEDLMHICQRKFPSIPTDQVGNVVKTAMEIDRVVSRAASFGQGGPWELNLRDVARWLALCKDLPQLPPSHHFRTVVGERFRTRAQRDLAFEVYQHVWPSSAPESFYHNITRSSLQVGTSLLARDGMFQRIQGPNSTIETVHLPAANSLITAINQNWPVILTGASGSGKTTLIRSIAAASGAELVEFSMNADVDTMDLIGGFEQYDVRRDIVRTQQKVKESLRQEIALSTTAQTPGMRLTQLLDLWKTFQSDDIVPEDFRKALSAVSTLLPYLRSSIEALSDLLSSPHNSRSRFVWNDGILVDAVEQGSWLVLDNANLCNPSVLDRLNALLEPNGVLAMSEQHSAVSDSRVIKPHPNFRIFLTVDPRYGELSRAMRNRSLEIFVTGSIEQEALQTTTIQYPYASSLARLRHLSQAPTGKATPESIESSVDNLSAADMTLISNGRSPLPGNEDNAALHAEWKLRDNFDPAEVSSIFLFSRGSTDVGMPQLIPLNEPMILLSGPHNTESLDLSSAELFIKAWYATRRVAEVRTALKDASAHTRTVAVKERNVLEKSVLLSSESTRPEGVPHVAAFANTLILALVAVFKNDHGDTVDLHLLRAIERILVFVQDVIAFCSSRTLDFALFHTYLQIGAHLARSIGNQFPRLTVTFRRCLNTLSIRDDGIKTGLGLQLMWQKFQPKVAPTSLQLESQLALEGLIASFDRVCRSLPQTRATLSALRSQFQQSYVSIVESDQPQTSLVALQGAVAALEDQSERGFVLEGNFQHAMSFIYQTINLQGHKADQASLETLAMFIPDAQRRLLPTEQDAPVPTSLRRLASTNSSIVKHQDLVGLDLIKQLSSVREQYLGMLNHAREELGELAKEITSHAVAFDNITPPLIRDLSVVLSGVMSSHFDLLTDLAKSCFSAPGVLNLSQLAKVSDNEVVLVGQDRDYFREVYLSHLRPVLTLLDSSHDMEIKDLQTCLIRLSLAGLILMVPNRVLDPAVYPNVAFQLHQRRVNEFNWKIQGQKQFHRQVMGQETSLVIRALQKELFELDAVPVPPTVVRPIRSELLQLQELFTRIIHLILPGRSASVSSTDPDWGEQWISQQGRTNLATIIERLEASNRAYDDFVKPIVWLLKCLSLGLDLATAHSTERRQEHATADISRYTPMLGASPADLQTWVPPYKNHSRALIRFRWLEYVGLTRSLMQEQSPTTTQSLVEILDEFYLEWKSHLSKEQVDAVFQSRYYTYRGDAAKDEEMELLEMSELFPQFDDKATESERVEAKYDARTTAVKLAGSHQSISSAQDPRQRLREYVLSALDALSRSRNDSVGQPGTSFTDLLPAILLQMESKVAELNGTQRPQSLNIYTDADVVECEKLFGLVQQIQSRFYTIAERWPEHAVPAEVLSFCREVMHLSIGDPIAKLLTKTEKLHEIATQWQSIASREWSVSGLLDELSALIVSWRRLELLSWSGLLDEERRRHEEDAHAWYFIVYESVIHNPTRLLADGEDVQPYCKGLAQTLDEFFKTTTLGQYSARIALLDTLNTTLGDLAEHEPQLRLVCSCVANITEHYRRYEPNVKSTLQSGRAELEKALKEQIKLASWKDTNITALRDSARRSHHKLFKIVRKYRSLLNQVVAVFKSSGESTEQKSIDGRVLELIQPIVDQHAVASAQDHCKLAFADWDGRPSRLTNPLGAVKSMRHLFLTKTVEVDVRLELASFREDLSESIKELRSETPATLTEENTAMVRHLQERKRRLLADTLKTAVQMGIRRNLPTSELEKQSSLALVLASPPDVGQSNSSPILLDANNTFHELLDVMSQVRAGRKTHSDDLTEGEVGRSIGLLEGLLSVSLSQRRVAAAMAESLRDLNAHLTLLRSCLTVPPEELSISPISDMRNDKQAFCRHLAWLVEVLMLATRTLRFQAQYADFDITNLLDPMTACSDNIRNLRSQFDGLPELPLGLTCASFQMLTDQSMQTLSQLGSLLKEWQAREPRVSFILRQIIPWTENMLVTQRQDLNVNGTSHITLQEFDDSLRTTVDQVFVALQKLSSAQEGMPKSVEDPGWLSQFDKYAVQAMRAVQANTISVNLGALLDKLHYLTPDDLTAARHLLTVASPIIEQYSHICEHLHDQQTAVHVESCQLALQLAISFRTLATQGFCRPSDSAKEQEQSGKLESGTGLGEGEGAEDISKDVGDDEDLSELAQSGEKEEQDGDMENADDAVDMGNDDLQGEMGDADEKESNEDEDEDRSGDEEGDELDEETGSVDDLDPTAVDEKMWDDMKDESEQDKEMKNDKVKGNKSEDQTAADGEKAEGEDVEGLDGEEEMEEEDDGDEGEGHERPEAENMDPHLDNEETLELPEELQLTGEDEIKDDEISDDGMDQFSDVDKLADEESDGEGDSDDKERNDQLADGDEETEETDETGVAQDDEVMEDPLDEQKEEEADHDTRGDDTAHDMDTDVDVKADGESGAANEAQDVIDAGQNVQGMNQADQEANPQQSQPGKAPENQEQGDTGKGATEQGAGRTDTLERQQDEALRKLADVLDQWHRRREILPAPEEQQQKEPEKDVDMADVDFEHVQDEHEADAQALGAATGDQAQNLDQSKAIMDDDVPATEDTDMPDVLEPEMQENIAERFSRLQTQPKRGQDEKAGAFVPGHDQHHVGYDESPSQEADGETDDLTPDIGHLELEHDAASPSLPTSASDAAQLWNQCSTTTHQFSLVLTEQLRLILSPTTATKLRGDYRTGKRLNIKRIIPYIASNYKRDKIWMRRSVASKRNYQIMIAVDDSKSMSESGADVLAFETLALLTKSLSMLEAGELCVVGFGDQAHVRVAHPFGTPFSPAESGPNVFRAFGFDQRGTNVATLVRESIQLFRDARRNAPSADAEDLWQLQLVVSDGHCSEHESVARLVRQAHADKIIVVFVIVDAGPESILDLKQAVFEPDPNASTNLDLNATSGSASLGEMRVRTKRYLEDFPFPYYLVVRDVRDLPGVLATALKGWFGSVVDVQG